MGPLDGITTTCLRKDPDTPGPRVRGQIVSRPGWVAVAVYRPDPVLLAAQIDTLQRQTQTDWTCLIGLDGADPLASGLCRRLTDGDARFSVREFETNVGVYRHFERLLAQCPPDVDWVALSDQDDVAYPEKLEHLVGLLDASPTTSAAVAQARIVTPDGRILGTTRRHSSSLLGLLVRNQMTGSLCAFRRPVLDIALPFPPATTTSMHDHWLAVCASAKGGIVMSDEIVQDYVQHANNVLGEGRNATLRAKLWEVVRSGPTRYVKEDAAARWRTSVVMARTLNDRVEGVPEVARINAIARGDLDVQVLRTLLELRRRGDLPWVGVGSLATGSAVHRARGWRS